MGPSIMSTETNFERQLLDRWIDASMRPSIIVDGDAGALGAHALGALASMGPSIIVDGDSAGSLSVSLTPDRSNG